VNIIDRVVDLLVARRMTIAEESMLPTLRPGDGVVFSKRALRDGGPRRGDIVLVRAPNGSGRLDVKRVVGLPGETVSIRKATVEIDGKPLDEPYLADWARAGASATSTTRLELHLGPDQFAVLSDNRVHPGAVDSRRYGPVGRTRIVGAMARRF
jgi:signal peptidase I